MVDFDYLDAAIVITTINEWERYVTLLRVHHNVLNALSHYPTLDIDFHYSFIQIVSFHSHFPNIFSMFSPSHYR